MGIVLDRPFPVFPDGFPAEMIAEFSRLTGRGVIGNYAASGTEDHRRARTRAHAHRRPDCLHVGRQRVPDCRARRDRAGARAVSRVRDRVSRWSAEGWVSAESLRVRSSARQARSSAPRTATTTRCRPWARRCWIALHRRGLPVVAIGKIKDLFAGRGIGRAVHTASDDEGMNAVVAELAGTPRGFIFTNLVDFDTQYGHRNDVNGYAENLERFDARLGRPAATARRGRPARHHGRSRQRPDDRQHRSRPRVRSGARRTARACAATRTSEPAGHLPISVRRSRRTSALGALAHGTSFLREIIAG